MSQQAARYLAAHGLRPSIDSSNIDLREFNITSVEAVDELGARATAEADRLGGPGRLYYAWVEALQIRDQLPSVSDTSGIPKSIGQLQADVANARAQSEQFFSALPSELNDLTLNGQFIKDQPVDSVMNSLHLMMVDTPPGPARNALSNIINQLDAAPRTSFTGIEWDIPEQLMTVEVNSSQDHINQHDPLWRPNSDGNSGLDQLMLRPSVSNDPLYSGITTMNPDGGGQYSVADDYIYQAAMAQQSGGNDFHQGDATNTFSE